ncbi:MAG: SDR family oxidoreductase [Saprospiraceae bacterium]|nr:SDR family oxidoreductase [Saprospiraceae bacterium]
MKNILVVGASKGIGAALSQKLIASANYSVYTISRTATSLEGTYQHFSADVLDSTSLPNIDVPLDGIAYCPGSINLKPFKALKAKAFQKDLDINLLGAVNVLQKYTPNLQKSSKASIVLFSTVAVQTGMSFHASIAAAKGAVEGLTRALAAEWAPKIRVNAIAPSLTATPLAARLIRTEQQIEASNKRHPLQRIGQAEDIANAAQFLLSDESDWMTGQILSVDGGLSSIRKI